MRLSHLNLLSILLYVSIIFGSCKNNTGHIIVVIGDSEDVGSLNTLVNSQTLKIGLINPAKTDEPVRILTGEFLSACSPEVSYDGKSMIFAGRRSEPESWQVWEMNLRSSRIRNISSCTENCFYPAYLPDSKVVFSKMISNDSLKSPLSLFRCNIDGTGMERITFTPAAWNTSTILNDGRILAGCSQDHTGQGESSLMVMRPDGTKAELFCKTPFELSGGKAIETPEGRIVFLGTESADLTEVVSVSYNNPFRNHSVLSGDINGEFLAVSSATGGEMLVCYRNNSEDKYKLIEFDDEKGLGKILHENKSYDIVDAKMIGEKIKQRKLPSEVDKLVKTGLLLCQDVNFDSDKKISKVEVAGIGASYGIFEPEADGSFYLKVIADMPFRLKTFDENGDIVNLCNWMSLRPNERRGCTGCHEDPEIVPINRIPEAVKKAPILIPVDLDGINEKIIELE